MKRRGLVITVLIIAFCACNTVFHAEATENDIFELFTPTEAIIGSWKISGMNYNGIDMTPFEYVTHDGGTLFHGDVSYKIGEDGIPQNVIDDINHSWFSELTISFYENGCCQIVNGLDGETYNYATDEAGLIYIVDQYDNISYFPRYNGKQALYEYDPNESGEITLLYLEKLPEQQTKIDFDALADFRYADQIYSFHDDTALVKKDNKYGFINTHGEIISNVQWDDARDFSEGMAAVCLDNKWGYIDTTGSIIVEPQWDAAYSFSEGLGCIMANSKYGFVDHGGRLVIPPIWEHSSRDYSEGIFFSEGFACVYEGFIDTKGELRIRRSRTLPFSGEYAFFSSSGSKMGIIDKSGNVIIEPTWFSIENFTDGCALVTSTYTIASATPHVDWEYHFINEKGEIINETAYDYAESFSEGFAVVKKRGKYNFIDTTGKYISETNWDYAESFSEGLALVFVGSTDDYGPDEGLYGFINTDGDIVFEPQWTYAESFQSGYALVRENGSCGFINKQGNDVIFVDTQGNAIMEFEKAFPFQDGYAIADQYIIHAEGGMYDAHGVSIVDKSFSCGYSAVLAGMTWRIMDAKGNFTW